MAEILKRDDFYNQGRRVCIIETEGENEIMGEKFRRNALACPFRTKEAVEFLGKDFKRIKFAECTHPDKHMSIVVFCPPMLERISEESSG